MWWNTFYCTNTTEPPAYKPGTEKGAVLVIDEMEINIEVIETKLDFAIEAISYEMDIELKVESSDLKFDIECL